MKPHKHADLIKAWADGAEIECWFGTCWETRAYPSWTPHLDYRIKPPKDKVYFACYDKPDSILNIAFTDLKLRLYEVKQNLASFDAGEAIETEQLKLTFDGSTRKIKSVEVL